MRSVAGGFATKPPHLLQPRHFNSLAIEHHCVLVNRRCTSLSKDCGVVSAPQLIERGVERFLKRRVFIAVDGFEFQGDTWVALGPRREEYVHPPMTRLTLRSDDKLVSELNKKPEKEHLVGALGLLAPGVVVRQHVDAEIGELL